MENEKHDPRSMYYAGQVTMTPGEAMRAFLAGAMGADNINLIGCRSGQLVAVSRASDSKYKTNDFPVWNAVCDCGNMSTLDSNDLMGYGLKKCCEECTSQRKLRAIRNYPEYKEWRKSVCERDNYTCQKSGEVGGILRAHHIEGYANNVESRTTLDNGITLCEKHHKNLHRLYGHDVGRENLEKWLNEPLGGNQ